MCWKKVINHMTLKCHFSVFDKMEYTCFRNWWIIFMFPSYKKLKRLSLQGKSCASHRWKIKLKKSVCDVILLRLTRFTGTTHELTESHLHIAQNWTASTIYYDLMNDIIRPFQSWLWVNIWASRLEGNQKLFTRIEYSVSVSSTQVRRQIVYN